MISVEINNTNLLLLEHGSLNTSRVTQRPVGRIPCKLPVSAETPLRDAPGGRCRRSSGLSAGEHHSGFESRHFSCFARGLDSYSTHGLRVWCISSTTICEPQPGLTLNPSNHKTTFIIMPINSSFTLPEAANALPLPENAAAPFFITFTTSNHPDTGESWCPDVRAALPLLNAAFSADGAPEMAFAEVGQRPE